MFKIFNPIYLGLICVLFMASCAKHTPKLGVDELRLRVEETLESMAEATGKTVADLKATIINMDELEKSLDGGAQQSAQSKEAQKLLEEIISKVAEASKLPMDEQLTYPIRTSIQKVTEQAFALSKQAGLIACLISMEKNKTNPNAGNITKAEKHLNILFTQTKSIQSEFVKIFAIRSSVELCKALENNKAKTDIGDKARNEALKILGYKPKKLLGRYMSHKITSCE